MLKAFSRSLVLLLSGLQLSGLAAIAAEPEIKWQDYNTQAFKQAQSEKKLLLLDLEAVWCHWCHVMDQETYHNPQIIQAITEHFIPLRVDQDARPDLANRFRDYGWPATIVFSADGTPLVKRSGYIEPGEMKTLLAKIAASPIAEKDDDLPESSASTAAQADVKTDSKHFPPSLKQSLEKDYLSLYDKKQGSWGQGQQKFIDGVSVEEAIYRAQHGDANAKHMALQTLAQERHLIDPIWGGASQYSTGGVWTHPHPEKLMSVQADALKAYALAYSEWKRPEDLKSAQQLSNYMRTFLRDEKTGVFFVSQDADVKGNIDNEAYYKLSDTERRKIGIPQVDRHIYARENGWAIEALSHTYQMTQDDDSLEAALKAAVWIMSHRQRSDGGYTHGAVLAAQPLYLGDNLAMGQAFLSLYISTGDKSWLQEAVNTANFIDNQFRKENVPGYWTMEVQKTDTPPFLDRDENLQLARWSHLLAQVSGRKEPQQMAENALKAIAQNPSLAESSFPALPLLANEELEQAPLHVTIIGAKSDPLSLKLFKTAIAYPTYFKRVDWWDKSEGPMVNPDVVYPSRKTAAAYICTNNRCSLPIEDPTLIRERIDSLNKVHLPVLPTPRTQKASAHAN
jgi:uncharacterized protein YyaL (SSP411 family)